MTISPKRVAKEIPDAPPPAFMAKDSTDNVVLPATAKEERKTKRLEIIELALKRVLLILGLSLFCAFILAFFSRNYDIFNSTAFIILQASLFSVLTLLIGVVAGTSID